MKFLFIFLRILKKMCSKTDSDATYCSEVEHLIKANYVCQKYAVNVPLRRSQRLSQKPKGERKFSWENVRITKNGKIIEMEENKVIPSRRLRASKLSQDIFNSEDLSEQEIVFPALKCQLNDFCLNDQKVIKLLKDKEDVPLDLWNKSKVSKRETSQGELDVFEAAQKEMKTVKNITKGKIKPLTTKKPGRFRRLNNESHITQKNSNIHKIPSAFKESLKENVKKSTLNEIKPIWVKNIQLLAENLLRNETNRCELPNLGNLKSDSVLIPNVELKTSKVTNSTRKSRKLCNKSDQQNAAIGVKTKELLKQKSTSKTILKSTTRKSKCLEISKEIKTLLESTGNDIKSKSFKRSQTASYPNNNVKILHENSTEFSSKRIKLSNENIALNQSQNQTELLQNSSKTSKKFKFRKRFSKTSVTLKSNKILEENNSKRSAITNKFLNQTKTIKSQKLISQNLKNTTNETPTIKRLQKRKSSFCKDNNSGKNTPKILIQSNELQHIKSEPLSSLEINLKSSNETKSINKIQRSVESRNKNNIFTENINKLPNNPTQAISQKSTSNLQTTVIKNNKLSQENVNKNEINYKNIKTEQSQSKQTSQTSSNKTKEVNISQKAHSTRRCKKLFEAPTNEGRTDTYKLKNPLQSVKSYIATAPKTLNKMPDKNIKSQTRTDYKPTNKNIMKYFDRTLYLDKIQTLTTYTENLTSQNSNYGKNNNLQIPPTPSESTQDLLRKSILPDVYPPHFKYQLPPQATLSSSLNLQTNPTYVITPDDTVTSELLESSSSSPSLPESLCELLQTKDIKEILNVEKVSYRLYNYHVQALALILNVRLEYLSNILDKIMKIKPDVLKSIDKAVNKPFVADYDLFVSSPEEMGTNGEVVFNSQSPK